MNRNITITDDKLWALIDSTKWKDFDSWTDSGFKVKKGEKCYYINEYALFNASQVERPRWHKKSRTHLPDGLDIDDMTAFTGEHCSMDFYS